MSDSDRRGLRVSILTGQFTSPGQHGLALRYKSVTVIPSDDLPVIPGPFEPTDDAPAVQLHWHAGNIVARPVDRPEHAVGPMASGAYLASSDSRWDQLVGYVAIPLHDRFETQAQYNALSSD